MNEKLASLIRVGNSFIDEYAQRFDMPELLSGRFEWEEHSKNIDKGMFSVRTKLPLSIKPRGQFSSIIKGLQASFTITVDQFDRHNAEVKLDYDHHGGGSNGYRVSFFLITEKDSLMLLKDPSETKKSAVLYKGFITLNQYHEVIRSHMKVRDMVKAAME